MLEDTKYGCVGTCIGSSIDNTNELKVVLGFNEAILSPDKNEWQELVDCEHARMLKNGVWEVVDCNNIPEGSDVIDSTWAMKKKVNCDYRAPLAAMGFKQKQRKSLVHHDLSSLVMHDITMHIILVMMHMQKLSAHLVDVNGAFLLGEFESNEKIYMKISQGFQKSFTWIVVLKKDSVCSKECSKNILEIVSWNHE